MSAEQLRRNAITLFKKRKMMEKKIERLQNQLVQTLCPKGKEECEPAYCVFRITDTCPFLKEWNSILEEAQVPKDDI